MLSGRERSAGKAGCCCCCKSSCRRPVRCPLEAGEGGGSHSSATGSGSACSLRRSLPEVADEVLELAGRAERRGRLLPARAVVCFVLALFLFSSSDSSGPPGYRVVLRTLAEKLRHLPGGIVQRLPASSALARARRCLGGKAFQESWVAGPTSTAQVLWIGAGGTRRA
ncbi:transposase domain-containing protein [Streptomyces sp. NPDC058255]|uniref:transposase domain-containing protein n=1 Tax=Streptomyces sp. NPDC058255 TaxID=3346407 RepID=UPI0036F0A746